MADVSAYQNRFSSLLFVFWKFRNSIDWHTTGIDALFIKKSLRKCRLVGGLPSLLVYKRFSRKKLSKNSNHCRHSLDNGQKNGQFHSLYWLAGHVRLGFSNRPVRADRSGFLESNRSALDRLTGPNWDRLNPWFFLNIAPSWIIRLTRFLIYLN